MVRRQRSAAAAACAAAAGAGGHLASYHQPLASSKSPKGCTAAAAAWPRWGWHAKISSKPTTDTSAARRCSRPLASPGYMQVAIVHNTPLFFSEREGQ